MRFTISLLLICAGSLITHAAQPGASSARMSVGSQIRTALKAVPLQIRDQVGDLLKVPPGNILQFNDRLLAVDNAFRNMTQDEAPSLEAKEQAYQGRVEEFVANLVNGGPEALQDAAEIFK